jgi:hypothetical protein
MSREISREALEEGTLSDDEKAYIAQRPQLRQEIILQGYDDPLEGYEYDPFGQKAAMSDGRPVAGSATVSEDEGPSEDGDEDPKVWNKSMPKAELRAVIEARNEGRDPEGDDYIVVEDDAKKDDLIAALSEDDNSE